MRQRTWIFLFALLITSTLAQQARKNYLTNRVTLGYVDFEDDKAAEVQPLQEAADIKEDLPIPTEGKSQILDLQGTHQAKASSERDPSTFPPFEIQNTETQSDTLSNLPLPVQFQSRHRPISLFSPYGDYAALPPQRTTETPKKSQQPDFPPYQISKQNRASTTGITLPLVDSENNSEDKEISEDKAQDQDEIADKAENSEDKEDYKKMFPEDSWSKSIEDDEENGNGNEDENPLQVKPTLIRTNGEKIFALEDTSDLTEASALNDELRRLETASQRQAIGTGLAVRNTDNEQEKEEFLKKREEELDRARKQLLGEKEKRALIMKRQLELRKALQEQERRRLDNERATEKRNEDLRKEAEEIERKIAEERRLRMEANRKLEEQRQKRKREEEEEKRRLEKLRRAQELERRRRLDDEKRKQKLAEEERRREERELQEELERQRIELEKNEKLKLLEEERTKREELQRLREQEEAELERQRERRKKEEKKLEEQRKKMVAEIETRQKEWELERQKQAEERLERRKARLSRLFARNQSKEKVTLIPTKLSNSHYSESHEFERGADSDDSARENLPAISREIMASSRRKNLRKIVVKDVSGHPNSGQIPSSELKNDESERFLGGWASAENQRTVPEAIWSSAERIKPRAPLKHIDIVPLRDQGRAKGKAESPTEDKDYDTVAPITSTTIASPLISASKDQVEEGYTDEEIRKYYENYYNEWYKNHNKPKQTSKSSSKSTTTQRPRLTSKAQVYQPLQQSQQLSVPLAMPQGRQIQTEPPTNMRQYQQLPPAQLPPPSSQYPSQVPQPQPQMGLSPLPYAMGQVSQVPAQPTGNLFGIIDPRQNFNNHELSKEQLDSTCAAIRLATRSFGIKDAAGFAKNNCAFIKMYFQNVTCEQIMHVMEYCGQKNRFFRKLLLH